LQLQDSIELTINNNQFYDELNFQINSLSISENDWKGKYFKAIPIKISTDDIEDLEFKYWTIESENGNYLEIATKYFKYNFDGSATITAHFENKDSNLNFENAQVQIYPTQVETSFIVSKRDNLKTEFSIQNSIGEMVYKDILNNSVNKINIANFAKGVYYLKIRNSKFNELRKLIKL